MDAARWARLESLFIAADKLSPEEREPWLAAIFAAEPDPELRAELEALLAATPERLEAQVAAAIGSAAVGLAAGEKPPARVGPYLLRGEIGRGGMATVYAAERADREFERKVAVKILRRGMDTDDIVRRLRRERQILANLDHPGIARLLDGGTAEDGRPYVVMEHIAGEPIDVYCRKHRLDLRARLRLFLEVCAAVHYAHRNLVLHRDLKPSNILVGADGAPKLLDFGIAKLLEADSEAADTAPEATHTGGRLLTPAWASPEQLRGGPLSTASDVYSLGLLLYLLTTDRRAYEVDPARPAELERIVTEVEPTSPGLGDDLDLVVMAALRKEPERRYASAEQLAEDLRRYLANLPVSARKDTLFYRGGKFVRRHRWGVAATLLVFGALVASAIFARHQAQEALAEKRRAERVAAFLTEVFEASDPGAARGRVLTARDVLDQGARRVRTNLREDPPMRAEMLGILGRVYQKLGHYAEAEGLLAEALELRGGRDSGDLAAAPAKRDLAAVIFERGRIDEAAALASAALAAQRQQRGSAPLELAASLRLLADIDSRLGHYEGAVQGYREVLQIQQQQLGPEAEQVATTCNSLGEAFFEAGNNEEARAAFLRALRIGRRLGEDHPELITALNNLAGLAHREGDFSRAKALFLEVLAARRRVFGARHANVATVLSNLAVVENQLHQPDEAIAHAEEALAISRALFGGANAEVADQLHNLGSLYLRQGRSVVRAEELLREALEMRRQVLGKDHFQVAQTLRALGELYSRDRPQQAEACYREALAVDRQCHPWNVPRLTASLVALGRLVAGRHDLPAAAALFREALELRQGAAMTAGQVGECQAWLGHLLAVQGQPEAGCALVERGHQSLREELGPDHFRTREAAGFLAACPRPPQP